MENKKEINHLHYRIEPRTRRDDPTTSLSFEVYDPLWMLTRQWQFGRFKGNDCGTAVNVKIRTVKRRLDYLYQPETKSQKLFRQDVPLEYEVEKMNSKATPYMRIESALYLKRKLQLADLNSHKLDYEGICRILLDKYSLYEITQLDSHERDLDALKFKYNSGLKNLIATYNRRLFDGYLVYKAIRSMDIKKNIPFNSGDTISIIFNEYLAWVKEKYFPNSQNADYWNESKLGYEVGIGAYDRAYKAEDYHTGRLSWYSFDSSKSHLTHPNNSISSGYSSFTEEEIFYREVDIDREKSTSGGTSINGSIFEGMPGGKLIEPNGKIRVGLDSIHNDFDEIKMLSYLPTPATYPGAPARKLWEMEKKNIKLGDDGGSSTIANAIIMKFATMYGNDWMITPLETETGTILDIDGIIVTDTFGEKTYINKSAEDNDKKYNKSNFMNRWSLYTTSKDDAYNSNNFSTNSGLLFPPTLARTQEGKPIEEIQFLRDEMANMLWGVENTINDNAGGTISAKSLSDAVLNHISEDTKSDNLENDKVKKEDYEYSYLLQNRVPLNWIPFIPEKTGSLREIAFRRAKMPIYYGGQYLPVRPSTELLRPKLDHNEKIKPLRINEEEILSYGTKVILNAQRTRWFLGTSYTWIGIHKEINQTQANSGLMFDELIDNEGGKAIKMQRQEG